MSVRSRALPRRVAAAACALFLLPVLATAVVAADPVQLQARALVAGRFEEGGWLGIAVSLTNDAQPASGFVVADGQDGPVRRAVELPAGARKQVTLYLRPSAFLRTVEIRFENASGERLAGDSADVKVLESSAATVALFGDPQGNLRAQVTRRGSGLAEPIGLTAADLPERPEPLAGIETIVWAGDSTTLTEAQRRSLERWVAAGGDLVVLGGPDWQSRTAAFDALLPVTGLSAFDNAPLTPLTEWATATLPNDAETATIAAGTPRADAYELVTGSGHSLLTARNSGAGRVIFVGVDLATAPFRDWDGAASFWSRLLPDDRLLQQIGGPGAIPQQQTDAQMSQALANLPSLQVPPAELLLGVIAAYILLIGPASYLVLRRFDRRELAWITAPVLVIVFSAGSYGIGSSIKGSDVIVNEVSIVRTASEASAASVSTYAGVFSPGRATYDLTVRSQALISSLANAFDGSGQAVAHVTEQGDPAHLRGLTVSVFGLQGVRAETVIPYQPSLQVSWHHERRAIVGSVTNTSDQPLSDVAVLADGGAAMVGDLAAGESADFSVSVGPSNGSQPSDRVYGFQNGEFRGTERELQVLTRRQVIDSLMNASGILAGKFGDIAIGAGSGGPYVVGWKDGGAPIDVEVDGQEVQRFSQSVEVLAGRPSLGPGEVTLDPSDLDVGVVATDGDVNQDAIATLLGNGTVDFRISLPLEASRLQPATLTIITGSDVGSILFDQSNANSPLPPGYRVSAFDVSANAWVELGDPNVRSRFEVEQPERFIGAGDSLLVRISGEGVPLEQGLSPVYATASLTGIIGR